MADITSALRLNMTSYSVDPDLDAQRYQAALDMAAYVDGNNFTAINLEEHHHTEIGWLPSPLIMAAAIIARTQKVMVSTCALLVPLYDPIRLAEDITVLDLISGGRFAFVAGLGYRPQEYHSHSVDWTQRGKLMDFAVETLLKAWSGESFDYKGQRVQITPTPKSRPHTFFFIGGASKAAAKRAARFGLPFFPPRQIETVNNAYYQALKEYGNEDKGFIAGSEQRATMLFVAENPDETWEKLGKYFLREYAIYTSWISKDRNSLLEQQVTSVEEIREQDFFQVLSPEQCLREAEQGADKFVLHPLIGGVPIEDAWQCLRLYVEKVMPHL